MKSITIHNLDTDVAKAVEKMATSTGLSQNKTVKLLLRKALGLEKRPKPNQDFSAFCGLWSNQEAEAFNKTVSLFERIDEDLWQ